ncbi:hypothetical protein Tco_0201035 [Tanacetum coccineum]
MEKEDPTVVTKALATNFDAFISKLSYDVNGEQVGTQSTNVVASGWEDPNARSFTEAVATECTSRSPWNEHPFCTNRNGG